MSFQTIFSQASQSIILRNAANTCSAEIYPFSALLNKFEIETPSGRKNIVDGFSSPQDAVKNITEAFKSAKLSPFACRMRNAKYEVNGQTYTVNKFMLPPDAHHGLMFDAVFDIVAICADEHSASVTLKYRYDKENAGYPFVFDTIVKWELHKDNKLSVTTTVENLSKQEIPYVDGWHPYFTLGETVDTATLQFDGDRVLEFDKALLPTGKVLPDTRFLTPTKLAGIELDNSFILAENKPDAGCIFRSDKLRLTISPDKSYPYLQIYIPPHRKSIALENLSGAPDAFNNKFGLQMLKPNTPSVFSTTYVIENI